MRVLSLAGDEVGFGFSILAFWTSGISGISGIVAVLDVLLRVNVLRHNVSIARKGM